MSETRRCAVLGRRGSWRFFGDVPGRPSRLAMANAAQLPQAIDSAMASARSCTHQRYGSVPEAAGRLLLTALLPIETQSEPLRRAFRFSLSDMPARPAAAASLAPTLREMAKLASCGSPDARLAVAREKDVRSYGVCASAEWLVRPTGQRKDMGSLRPFSVRSSANPDARWLIHRNSQANRYQLEYANNAMSRRL